MSGDRSIFFEEWLKTLREQYKYVVRTGDSTTQASLTEILYEAGFGEDELRELANEAGRNVDSVEGTPTIGTADSSLTNAHPAECACPDCIEVNEAIHDEEGQLLPEPNPEPDEQSENASVFATVVLEESDLESNSLSEEVPSSDDTTEDAFPLDQVTLEADVINETEVESDEDTSDDEPPMTQADSPTQMSLL